MSLIDPAQTNASRNSGNGDDLDHTDSGDMTNLIDASTSSHPIDTASTSLSASSGPNELVLETTLDTITPVPLTATATETATETATATTTTNSHTTTNGSTGLVQPLSTTTTAAAAAAAAENNLRNFKVLYDPFLDTSKTRNTSLICRYQEDLIDEVDK